MQTTDLRIAVFTGNYNYVRDGANQALNRLVGFLLDQGVAVRIYSPTIDVPAFEPVGDLVGIPSFPLPGRGEYRVGRSEEHTSELQSLLRISYAVFCLTKKKKTTITIAHT